MLSHVDTFYGCVEVLGKDLTVHLWCWDTPGPRVRSSLHKQNEKPPQHDGRSGSFSPWLPHYLRWGCTLRKTSHSSATLFRTRLHSAGCSEGRQSEMDRSCVQTDEPSCRGKRRVSVWGVSAVRERQDSRVNQLDQSFGRSLKYVVEAWTTRPCPIRGKIGEIRASMGDRGPQRGGGQSEEREGLGQLITMEGSFSSNPQRPTVLYWKAAQTVMYTDKKYANIIWSAACSWTLHLRRHTHYLWIYANQTEAPLQGYSDLLDFSWTREPTCWDHHEMECKAKLGLGA